MKRTPLQRKTPLAQRSPRRASTAPRPKRSGMPAARTSKIRSSAKGQPCQVRLPGICNHDPATVVAAHLRIAGTCGVGLKPSDLLTVRACEACHAVIDGRARAPDLPVEQLTLYVHEAHCRTLVEYEKEGLIHAD